MTKPRRFRVSYTVDVEVTVSDPDVFERITGPNGDEWRDAMYDFHTERDVVEHLAFNALLNGACHVSELEGWADLDVTAARMEVDRDSADCDYFKEIKP